MGLDATARRRWAATLALAAAIIMLVTGQTVFRQDLQGRAFVVFWLSCFGFTFLAMLLAIWDARAVRQRTRSEQRQLLEGTVQDILKDAKDKSKQAKKRNQRN